MDRSDASPRLKETVHELNNHLAIIVGYIDLVIAEVDPEHHLYPDLVEIQQAAKAAMVLGRRLADAGRPEGS